DTQIGKLLEELDRLNLRENTLIVLWGDHGWKLGEHGMWGKHTPFEIDAHSPLIFSAPGFRNGSRVKALTEFVDIYPTICELSGIPIPKHLEGDSLVSLLKDEKADWKSAAFTQWPKHKRYEPDKVITAYSIKTDRYRYIEWTRNATAEILARELYDHVNDPNENKNVADYPQNLQIIKGLSKRLDGGKGWRNHKSQ
ncbi:MAG: DUF4976 domain-containing protein, partial [Melioribacteraceae bacterium]|nr:DUF4976 domain-containing protein [Melioribacteraceae bacterium]